MDKRTITLIVVLFILVVVGMFIFAYLNRSERETEPLTAPSPAVTPEPYPGVTRIDAKHFYQDGMHTFAGEIVLPTPCDLLDATAVVAESYPEQITLQFKVINNAEVCIQKSSTQRFLVTAAASSEATIKAEFMGRPVTFNAIPAAPGESPENYELFIKG